MGSSTAQLSMMGDDDELGFEAFQTNGAILMSLLEEFQEEESDDEERVNSLIQSLEAEITSPSSAMDNNGSGYIDSELTIRDFEEGNDYSDSLVDSELGWFDMEQVPCSPSGDMNWYMDSCEYKMDCLNDSGIWVGDYSHICYGAGLEDNGYNSIWQETAYDSIMYD
ncbi:hypothetical protein RchiOBHm_Chr5g0028181 [Rosa chinensis]|uniref:Uncharacterized protein n=1 Tax=Rosa chinensis TaxID=74649 RepID=A0A2P6Q9B5_ROSCH|nr:hypothetical protein RchiOBHm_Chr5g0028181 [Rosa chinensis]